MIESNFQGKDRSSADNIGSNLFLIAVEFLDTSGKHCSNETMFSLNQIGEFQSEQNIQYPNCEFVGSCLSKDTEWSDIESSAKSSGQTAAQSLNQSSSKRSAGSSCEGGQTQGTTGVGQGQCVGQNSSNCQDPKLSGPESYSSSSSNKPQQLLVLLLEQLIFGRGFTANYSNSSFQDHNMLSINEENQQYYRSRINSGAATSSCNSELSSVAPSSVACVPF